MERTLNLFRPWSSACVAGLCACGAACAWLAGDGEWFLVALAGVCGFTLTGLASRLIARQGSNSKVMRCNRKT